MKLIRQYKKSFSNLSPRGQRSLIGVMIYSLFNGLVFWWAIEQLLLNELSDSGVQLRGYVNAAFIAAFTISNLPLGSFSDRHGRRLSMGISALGRIFVFVILAFSENPAMYVIGAGLYGLIEAFDEGANDAYLYDTLKDEGREKSFNRITGLNEALFLIGIFIANLASGFLAEGFGLRATYLMSIPSALIILLAVIWLMHEPSHHRDNSESVISKMRTGFKLTLQPAILLLAVASAAGSLVVELSTQFGQAQFLETSSSTIGLSIYWAIGALLLAAGAAVAYKVTRFNAHVMAIGLLIALAMIFVGGWAAIVLVTVIFVVGQILEINIEAAIQDKLPSKVRSTVSSVVGTGSGLVQVAIFIFAGYLGEQIAVHRMVGLILAPAALIGLAALIANRRATIS